MDEEEIFKLYKNLKRAFDSSDWDLIEESIDYLTEYIDLRDEDETFDELN
jgi:glutaredoxin-related protein